MTKLKTILLVDDDEATNYLNKRAIRLVGCAEETVVVGDGRQALDYLDTAANGVHPKPELILLDINMPRMNGWEFLEAYARRPEARHADNVIVMLTASLNPDDRDRAARIDEVADYKTKPLTETSLRQILASHFPAWG